MNYPVWDVPVIGSGWVIGSIAIFHVVISHFAIGGGFYLPIAERKAIREGRDDWMQVIRKHSKFFMILTGVFGAVSGVGIWFSIGLANPEGTSTLIHNYVFGWAIEWVFFMVEFSAAAVYYYTWDRIPQKHHVTVGWIYAINSWLSLVIINGILTFMLTPGEWLEVAGTGTEPDAFWNGFFNPTYWPSVFLRTTVCVALGGLFALVTASRLGEDKLALKEEVIRWSTRWLLPAFFLMPVFMIWYVYQVPVEQRGLFELGISTIGQGTFTHVTRAILVTVMTSATVAGVVYFLAYRNPRDFSLGHAIAILVLALAATGSTEQAREMLRKPYVIGGHMYSNGIRVSEVEGFNADGYLTDSIWGRAEERQAWAALDSAYAAAGDEQLPPAAIPAGAAQADAHLARGELMFRGQCMNCHTTDGYRSMTRLLGERDREAINSVLQVLHENPEDSPYRKFMPPLVGTRAEREALADYLHHLVLSSRGGVL